MKIGSQHRGRRAARVMPMLALLAAACAPAATPSAPDPMNATFQLERSTVTLANGRAEREAAPGSATKVVTSLTDRRASGDVDGDGRADAVVVLTHQPGGSGTFYYVAALLNTSAGVTATPAILLGDRIMVNALRLDGRAIVVELLDRAAGQPLTASPTVASTKRFEVDRGALVVR
jgi:hypothetical protein